MARVVPSPPRSARRDQAMSPHHVLLSKNHKDQNGTHDSRECMRAATPKIPSIILSSYTGASNTHTHQTAHLTTVRELCAHSGAEAQTAPHELTQTRRCDDGCLHSSRAEHTCTGVGTATHRETWILKDRDQHHSPSRHGCGRTQWPHSVDIAARPRGPLCSPHTPTTTTATVHFAHSFWSAMPSRTSSPCISRHLALHLACIRFASRTS